MGWPLNFCKTSKTRVRVTLKEGDSIRPVLGSLWDVSGIEFISVYVYIAAAKN